ncbi:hypothetical protein SteCoe_21293 [Stentor coeruleus]|uniref:ADP-ribosylation factor n=1 Tax=Stentor coeruleus TaxID=5963 RepID=A0A1R2BQ27_9CILI|nr:hypothetical protein SteCoe_21293 [Stentor coeruleus]
MGAILTRIWAKFLHLREARIAMLGLDASGKTTVLYKLKLGEVVCTIPTIGFNVERVDYKNIHFTVWDVGGQDKIRPLWRYYLDNIQAVIYLIDSNDTDRIDEASEELERLMKDPTIEGVPFLVFCNKQDLPKALTCADVIKKLNLTSYKRQWKAQSLCALTGEGLSEGLDWLVNVLNKN